MVDSASSSRGRTFLFLLYQVLVGGICFYAGTLLGIESGYHHGQADCSEQCGGALSRYLDQDNPLVELKPQQAGDSVMIEQTLANAECSKKLKEQEQTLRSSIEQSNNNKNSNAGKRFPKSTSQFAVGMSLVNRSEFTEFFEMGVPLDYSAPSNNQVVLIHTDGQSLPPRPNGKLAEGAGEIPLLSVKDGTRNCDVLNVVLTQSSSRKQCVAIIGQYGSYHIQKYMRLPDKPGSDGKEYDKINSMAPLRYVNRGAQPSGRKSQRAPTKKQTLTWWKTLAPYLRNLDTVLQDLEPVAAKVAKKNTVIVMVCNHGQSELLMNFVCAAKSRNIDLSPVLVFVTDEETKELAEGLGLTAFFDRLNYEDTPKKAARSYGDGTFAKMMMAKVYCVQMTTMLGYDVLFQDVDIVWFKDPLEYFHDESSPVHNFDIYFQDDGNRAIYYAPYSANTGLYYVRNSDATRHFFNSLLMSGDLVASTRSHQIALVALLSEHASMYGMKVKVLSRDTVEFPGGHAYHKQRGLMKSIMAGQSPDTVLFHMSWTLNKDNKKLYFRQMGEWYVQDTCISKTMNEIHHEGADLVAPCCSAEPIITCHYRDKPSKYPCKDSPPIDNGGSSWWK